MFGRNPMRRAERDRAKTEAEKAKQELHEARATTRKQRAAAREAETATKATGTGPWYAVAAIGTGVSVDTSWRFFGEVLHITGMPERPLLFSVLEAALLASGWSMRASVRRTTKADERGTPGPARWVAYALLGLSAYMAITMSGPIAGIARTVLGPGLALVGLHLALGIEVSVRHLKRDGALKKIGRELKERLLSLFGVDDSGRKAAEIRRDRAVVRAARLATTGRTTSWRLRRLGRAVRASGAATDPARRDKLLAEIDAQRHLRYLCTREGVNPWLGYTPAVTAAPVPAEVLHAVRGTMAALPAGTRPVLPAEERPELPAAASSRRSGTSGGTKTGTSSRGSRGTSRGKKPAPSPRRSPEEHRERAAELRTQHPEISQVDLARLMGITPRYLRQVEQVNGSHSAS